MNRFDKMSNKRTCERTSRSDAMFWRPTGDSRDRMAWTLESSADGLAFLWRGAWTLGEGAVIDVKLRVADGVGGYQRMRVVRAVLVHDDLMVIAGELIGSAEGAGRGEAVADVERKPYKLRAWMVPELALMTKEELDRAYPREGWVA